VTVRGIAEKAGVSIGTVDRVIHNRGRVSPETRDKILGIIAESGYTPNPIARHLKLNKKHTFAVIMPAPYEDSSYLASSLRGYAKGHKRNWLPLASASRNSSLTATGGNPLPK